MTSLYENHFGHTACFTNLLIAYDVLNDVCAIFCIFLCTYCTAVVFLFFVFVIYLKTCLF